MPHPPWPLPPVRYQRLYMSTLNSNSFILLECLLHCSRGWGPPQTTHQVHVPAQRYVSTRQECGEPVPRLEKGSGRGVQDLHSSAINNWLLVVPMSCESTQNRCPAPSASSCQMSRFPTFSSGYRLSTAFDNRDLALPHSARRSITIPRGGDHS